MKETIQLYIGVPPFMETPIYLHLCLGTSNIFKNITSEFGSKDLL